MRWTRSYVENWKPDSNTLHADKSKETNTEEAKELTGYERINWRWKNVMVTLYPKYVHNTEQIIYKQDFICANIQNQRCETLSFFFFPKSKHAYSFGTHFLNVKNIRCRVTGSVLSFAITWSAICCYANDIWFVVRLVRSQCVMADIAESSSISFVLIANNPTTFVA